MGVSYNPKIVTDGLLLNLDAGNAKSYNGSSNYAYDTINGFAFQLVNLGSTMSYDSATKSFRSTRTPGTRNGGYMTCPTSGVLAAPTYLNGNHTTEVWVRINDKNPTNYDATETSSTIFTFPGYHCMFFYSSTYLSYTIWNGNSSAVSVGTTSFSEGKWFQVVTTRQSNTLTLYMNGISIATASGSMTVTSVVTDYLRIGAAFPGGAYNNAADCNVACAKMYNRALLVSEIQQNFNALRGRYGI